MTDNELCYLYAVEAIARFKARKLSAIELMCAVIARAEAVEPTINAFPQDSVRAHARPGLSHRSRIDEDRQAVDTFGCRLYI